MKLTTIEKVALGVVLGVLIFWGVLGFVIIHFVHKVW